MIYFLLAFLEFPNKSVYCLVLKNSIIHSNFNICGTFNALIQNPAIPKINSQCISLISNAYIIAIYLDTAFVVTVRKNIMALLMIAAQDNLVEAILLRTQIACSVLTCGDQSKN